MNKKYNQDDSSNHEQTSLSQNIDLALCTQCNQLENTSDSNEIESIDLSTSIQGIANETFHLIRNQTSKEEKLEEATLRVFKVGDNYQSYHHLRNISENFATQWGFCVCRSGQVII